MKKFIIAAILIYTASCAFDEQLAKQLAAHCVTSYCNKIRIRNWTCGKTCSSYPKVKDITVIRNKTHDNVGFLSYDLDRKAIIITFRGTPPWNLK